MALGFVLQKWMRWRALAWFGRVWRAGAQLACLPLPMGMVREWVRGAARERMPPGREG